MRNNSSFVEFVSNSLVSRILLNHRLIIRQNLSDASLYERAQAHANTQRRKLSAGINFSSVNNAMSLSRATARACRPHPRGIMVKIDV